MKFLAREWLNLFSLIHKANLEDMHSKLLTSTITWACSNKMNNWNKLTNDLLNVLRKPKNCLTRNFWKIAISKHSKCLVNTIQQNIICGTNQKLQLKWLSSWKRTVWSKVNGYVMKELTLGLRNESSGSKINWKRLKWLYKVIKRKK